MKKLLKSAIEHIAFMYFYFLWVFNCIVLISANQTLGVGFVAICMVLFFVYLHLWSTTNEPR